jgi:uncharacterized protein YbaR (Trm112 family)
MNTNFLCPKCRNYLNVGENLVFSTRNRAGKGGLILLHPQLGDYTVVKHPDFEIGKGELIDFFCPFCNKKLVSDRNANLAKVLMLDDKDTEYEIHFSRISGQHSTYKIIGKSVEIFGEDAADYFDFLNTGNL